LTKTRALLVALVREDDDFWNLIGAGVVEIYCSLDVLVALRIFMVFEGYTLLEFKFGEV
jgi:hypothetical protein